MGNNTAYFRVLTCEFGGVDSSGFLEQDIKINGTKRKVCIKKCPLQNSFLILDLLAQKKETKTPSQFSKTCQ